MKTNRYLWHVPRFFTAVGLKPCIIILAILATYFIPGDVCRGVSFIPKETAHVKSAGNLYEKPAENSSVTDKLKEGDTVTFILSEGEWCIIKLSDDRLGWAHKSLFADKPQVSEKKETAEEIPPGVTPVQKKVRLKFNRGRVREEPSLRAGIKLTLEKGETVSAIGAKEGWYLVRLDNGTVGWAHQGLFIESDEPLSSEDASGKDFAKEIKEIKVDITPGGEEKIVFVLNGFYPPETFVIEESVPKVVCDFFGLRLGSGIRRQTEVNGDLVQKIRIGVHKGAEPKTRVVMDLVSDRDYEVEQIFFRKENLYTLTFKSVSN
ncbi:SH3 domain-containing protein [Desulfonema magnum]|uniref:SH3-like and AMIN domain-containing protein n=1 Tax=Desulfonema magnum TaxID=45655 RepID=A0A975BLP0_9BACT|nr:SH3 domain-containing protein [Desulfonema magnum]QTA87751.1 SH3-like and AMIN domain-containing protein [Desulfonema magnum]